MTPKLIPGIATQSLGRAWNHSLPEKLQAAARHGMQSVEIFHEDLAYLADSLPEHIISPPGTSFPSSTATQERQLAAASEISVLCSSLSLDIICLQPFMHYEGLRDRAQYQQRLAKLHFWIHLAHALGTDLIQIPSNFLPEAELLTPEDPDTYNTVVADLRTAADIGLAATPPIRFAHEALCWGTHTNKWEQAYALVEAVNRPNFGTCLDTFNILGRIYADPTSSSGTTIDAHDAVRQSLQKMRSTVDMKKVFYVELCDGERLANPISSTHEWYDPAQPPRMTWSRNARLFPFEEDRGGYLPVMTVFETLLDMGFEGYVSFEIFNRSINAGGPTCVEDHARRAGESWKKVIKWCEEREQRKKREARVAQAVPVKVDDLVLTKRWTWSAPLSRVQTQRFENSLALTVARL